MDFWNILIVILATVTILSSWYQNDQRKRKLQCVTLFQPSIIEVPDELSKKIDISYNNQPVDDLSQITVKIRNSGTEIDEKDVELPIQIQFDKEIKMIDHGVVSVSEPNIKVDLNPKEDNQFECKTGLLNRGDEITLKFICSGKQATPPKVTWRIKGTHVNVISISSEDLLDATSSIRIQFREYIYIGIFIIALSMMTISIADMISTWKGLPKVSFLSIRDPVLHYGGMACGYCLAVWLARLQMKSLQSPESIMTRILRRIQMKQKG